MHKKCFYYIEPRTLKYKLDLDFLDSGALPLLWNYKGLLGYLSRAHVEDRISLLKDWQKRTTHPFITMYFEDLERIRITGRGNITTFIQDLIWE